MDATKASFGSRAVVSRLVLIIGLVIWTAAQGYLTSVPVWTRDLPPEVDDSLAYLVRTHEIEECFFQNCPALVDLRRQIQTGMPDPEAAKQLDFAGFAFPFYHPGFSLVLLGIEKFGVDLTKAYKILWSFSPVFFGLGFACLLSAVWGRRAAGGALVLLAFKVFPYNGLHYLTPSNFAMGIAMFVWARVIARQGDAPFTLIAGALVLFSVHPVGGVYAIAAVLLALLMPGSAGKKRAGIAGLIICVMACGMVLVSLAVKKPSFINALAGLFVFPGFAGAVQGYAANILGAVIEIVVLKEGLFGPFSLFFFAVALGFWTAPRQSRSVATRLAGISILFFLSAFYITNANFSPPADVFFRLWIPVVVILFGAVGNALCFALQESFHLVKELWKNSGGLNNLGIKAVWPLLAAALLVGYSLDMVLAGGEQIQATVEYMTDRQPISFDPHQPSLLLSSAKPGDKVLYTSTMAMAYYFLHGAMSLGAVYYHPSFAGSEVEKNRLRRPEPMFAVAYNPTVYHPSLEGLDEKDRCITFPEHRFSPLSHRRKHGPIDHEGYVRAADFSWIQLEPRNGDAPKRLGVSVKNPGKASQVELLCFDSKGEPVEGLKAVVPAAWTGVVKFDIDGDRAARFRLLLPAGGPEFLIDGISFDNDSLHWPWMRKALVTLSARDPETGTVVLSFDPADLMPAPLKEQKVKVLADRGSSVLLQVGN